MFPHIDRCERCRAPENPGLIGGKICGLLRVPGPPQLKHHFKSVAAAIGADENAQGQLRMVYPDAVLDELALRVGIRAEIGSAGPVIAVGLAIQDDLDGDIGSARRPGRRCSQADEAACYEFATSRLVPA